MIELDDDTRQKLRREQKTNRDKRVYVKVTVILMLDKGFSVEMISTSLGIDMSTIYRYESIFKAEKLEQYLLDHFKAYTGKLRPEQELQLVKEVSSGLYITSKEVCDWVLKQFSVEYSAKGMVKLLHRLGFVYKKTKHVPAFADVEKQKEFIRDFGAFMVQKTENTVVYFNDGVHPQHNTKPEYGWILRGKEQIIPANTGRNRLNITGLLNAEDVTDVIAHEDIAVNAQSAIIAWERAEKRHPNKEIVHICDNARYYHSQLITEWLKQHPNTTVKYLPPYAPNLNLIERLWKFLRKTTISSFFYATFDSFKKAVMDFFNNIKEHRTALESLLTLKFHLPNYG